MGQIFVILIHDYEDESKKACNEGIITVTFLFSNKKSVSNFNFQSTLYN